MQAGEDWRIAEGIAAAFGLPQRHDEIEEIFRLIGFEGYDPFLVVEVQTNR